MIILTIVALDIVEIFLFIQIPKYGIFENVNSLRELAQMPQWTEDKPLRVATGFTYVCQCFLDYSILMYLNYIRGIFIFFLFFVMYVLTLSLCAAGS